MSLSEIAKGVLAETLSETAQQAESDAMNA